MLTARGLKSGMVIKHSGELFRVVSSTYHLGGGHSGGMVHTTAQNLLTGHIRDWRLNPDERMEEVSVDRQEMEYLYADDDHFYFMNVTTFDQIPLPKEAIGHRETFLLPNMRIPMEFYEGKPIGIVFPQSVELKVITAPPPIHEHDSSTYKSVVLENGMEVLTPQFIKEGEYIKVDVETGKYLERVRK